MAADTPASAPRRHRPRSATVFVAAFVAGAAAAVGVNRALDVHLSQAKPQVECEPIFVALRSLPQGVPVTVWDVALRDWPKAMLPSTALRVTDSFEGCLLKYPLREGQPLLAAQLVKPEPQPPAASETPARDGEAPIVEEAFVPPTPAAAPVAGTEPAAAPVAAADVQRAEPTTQTAAVEPERATAPPTLEPETVAVADDTPSPAVAGQPTLAVPATESAANQSDVAVQQPEPAVAAATPVPSRDEGESPRSIDADFDVGDMPSRPAADLAKIPSVMSQAGAATAPPAEETGTGAGVRYLVVPERIARQADTSFTAPVAPEGRSAGERDQSSAPQRAAAAAPSAASATTTPAPQPRTTIDQAQTQQDEQAQRGQSAQPRQRQATSRQPQTGQQGPKQQAKPTAPRGQSQQQSAAGGREESSSRAWGGMFPNVSAGLEAMGGWRGRVREAAVPQNESARP